MRAAVLKSPRQMAVEDIETPVAGPDEVLIRVRVVGICGSDILAYEGNHPRRQPPVILGHEFSGDIVGLGQNVRKLNLEDRVTVMPQAACGVCAPCRRGWTNLCDAKRLLGSKSWPGAFAEYVAAPQWVTYRLPDSLGYTHGGLVEPLAVAVHTVHQGQIELGDRVAVLGAGPIGLLSLLCAINAGAQEVIAADRYTFNLEAAGRFGASCLIDTTKRDPASAVRERYGANGVDVAIVAAGAPELIQAAFDMVRKRGRIVLVAIFGSPALLDIEKSRLKEQEIVASSTYTHEDFIRAIRFMTHRPRDIESIVTRRAALEEVNEAMLLVKHRSEDLLKVMITIQ